MPQSHPSSQLQASGQGRGTGSGVRDGRDGAVTPLVWQAALDCPLLPSQGSCRQLKGLQRVCTVLVLGGACSPTAHLQASSGLASLEHGSQRCPAGLGQQEQALEHSHPSLQSQLPVEHLGQAQCFPMVKSGCRVGARGAKGENKAGWGRQTALLCRAGALPAAPELPC
jgi:hypothetical protein